MAFGNLWIAKSAGTVSQAGRRSGTADEDAGRNAPAAVLQEIAALVASMLALIFAIDIALTALGIH
jgi:hypothetical protein